MGAQSGYSRSIRKTLFVSDLDGTLLGDNASLSAHSRRELAALIGEGVPITIASARSIYSIRPILGDMPFRLPIIEANGAFITDYASGRKEAIRSLDRDTAHHAFETLMRAGLRPFITGHGADGDFLRYDRVSNAGMAAYVEERLRAGDQRVRETGDLLSVIGEPSNSITSISAIDGEEKIAEMARTVFGTPRRDVFATHFAYRERPEWSFFTLHHRLATKDNAIRFLRSGWGFEEAELVVFGDDMNDKGMFAMADRCVAPSNANPAIKALAHEIIGSNGEDSVVRYIRARADIRKP